MNEITTICQECGKQFEYVLKPGFPRKYCFECSEIKKASFAGPPKEAPVPVVKPSFTPKPKANGQEAMYVSYAKDIFCALLDKLDLIDSENQPKAEQIYGYMAESIKLVKQAKESF